MVIDSHGNVNWTTLCTQNRGFLQIKIDRESSCVNIHHYGNVTAKHELWRNDLLLPAKSKSTAMQNAWEPIV